MDFSAQLAQLPEMLKFICDSAQKHRVPHAFLHKLELASEEVLVNIIHYAYQEGIGDIQILVKGGEHFFEVSFLDKGIAFNPLEKKIDTQSHLPVHERKIGGLGIFLVRKLIDEIEYQRVGDKNRLTLRVKY